MVKIALGCCIYPMALFANWKHRYYWQGVIEKGELGTLKKDMAEIERMLKALIKSLEQNP